MKRWSSPSFSIPRPLLVADSAHQSRERAQLCNGFDATPPCSGTERPAAMSSAKFKRWTTASRHCGPSDSHSSDRQRSMRNTMHAWLLAASACLFAFLAQQADASAHHDRGLVLHVPCSVHGSIGGEAHAAYVYPVRKGESLIVRLAWEPEDANVAEFTISEGKTFETAEPLAHGTWSRDGREWSGTMKKTGRVFIYVVAHPSAHYTLTIRRRVSTSQSTPRVDGG